MHIASRRIRLFIYLTLPLKRSSDKAVYLSSTTTQKIITTINNTTFNRFRINHPSTHDKDPRHKQRNWHTEFAIYLKKTHITSRIPPDQWKTLRTPVTRPGFNHHLLLQHFVFLCTKYFQRINSYNNNQLHPTRYWNKNHPHHKDSHPNGLQLVLQFIPTAVRFPFKPTTRPFC